MAKSIRNQQEPETPSNDNESLADQIFAAMPILVGVAAVVVVGILVYSFINSRSAAARASASTSLFFSADDPDAMESVYRKHPGTAAALWARQAQADSQMAEASFRWYLNREAADELASEALENYEVVLNESISDMMTTRSTLGAAKANEALGNLDEAVALYKDVLSGDASEVLTEQVNEKLEFLESESGKDFFVWYKDFKPFDTSGLNLPNSINSLPSQPDFNMPEFTPSAPAAPTGTGLSIPNGASPPAASPPAATPPSDSAPGLTPPPAATESANDNSGADENSAGEVSAGEVSAGEVSGGEMSETNATTESVANASGGEPEAGEPAMESQVTDEPIEAESPASTEEPVTSAPAEEKLEADKPVANPEESGSSRPPRVQGVKKDK